MALGEGGDDRHGAAAAVPLIAGHEKHVAGIVRSGSMWTAAAHVITAVIGSGVLSLAWSIAQLGWVAGPAAMLVFAGVTALQSTLFADCYRSPDPEHGPHRNRTYAGAVDRNLGSSSSWVCMLLQHTALFGYGIAYTITASISCREGGNEALGKELVQQEAGEEDLSCARHGLNLATAWWDSVATATTPPPVGTLPDLALRAAAREEGEATTPRERKRRRRLRVAALAGHAVARRWEEARSCPGTIPRSA